MNEDDDGVTKESEKMSEDNERTTDDNEGVTEDNQGSAPQPVVPPPPYSKETEDERFLQSTVAELQERGLFRGGKES